MITIFGITSETIVNDTTKPYAPYSQENPDVAVDSAGNFVVVWDGINDVSDPSFPTYAAYGQRFGSTPAVPFTAPATKLGGEFQLNNYDVDNQSHVSLAVGGIGTFIAVWDSYFQLPDSEYGVYARRYDGITSGNSTSGVVDVPINTTTTSNQRDPSVALDGVGNYVVAWQGTGPGTTDGNDIYIQRFTNSGGIVQGETKVNTSANGILEVAPIVAMNASGTFVVVWVEQNSSGDDNVFFALYSAGGLIKGPTQANQTAVSAQNNPSVAINDNGEFAIAWQGSQGGTSDIYARKFNNLGNPASGAIGNETLVHVSPAGQQVAPDIDIDNNGNFVVAWQDSSAEGTGTDGIYARRFISTGADGDAVRVNQTTTRNQFQPAIAMNNSGDFVVTWVSDQVTTNDNTIYARQFIVNDAPVDLSLSKTDVNENVPINTVVGIIAGTDPDLPYDTLTYSLVAGAGSTDNASFNISGNQLRLNISPNFEAKNTYNIRLRVTDQGTLVYEEPFVIAINDVNEAPTDVTFSNTTTSIAENTSTASPIKVADLAIVDDALGSENLTLTGADASAFTIIGSALYLQSGVALNFEAKANYSVTVNVDDPTVGITPDVSRVFNLTVTDVNEAPTAVNLINTTTTIAENTNTSSAIKVADITVTDDALGTETLLLSGADAGSFTIIGNALYLKAGTTLDFESKSSYNVTVNADDPTVGVSPDISTNFTLTLTDVNEAPTAASLTNTVTTLAEGTNTSSVTKVADITITDDALGTETLSLSGADAGSFTIIGNALYLQAGTTLDFETKPTYNVTVQVDDTTVGSTPDFVLPFTLTVTDVNEAPTAVNFANTTTTIAENASTASRIKVADISITDDALGTENLTLSGADAASFEIDTGVLYLKAGTTLNVEAKSTYSVTVNVDDPTIGSTPDFALPFTLTLTDVNEAPTAVNFANTTTTIAENTSTASRIKVADISITDDALGTEDLTLSGADAASFEIDTGILYLKAGVTLDYETKSAYSVTVNADDTTVGGTPDVSSNFTLTLTDVNEAPTAVNFANTTTTIAENTSTASRIKVADIAVVDSDGGTNTLSLSGADAGSFEIDTGVLYLKASTTLDFEAKSTYNVAVNVDDATVGATPDASSNFTLTLTDVNEAPTAASFANTTTTIAENTSTTSRIKVADITITDDALGTENLALSGADAASFEIDTGVLYLKAGTTLNFEAKSTYSVTVNVDDVTVGGTPDVSNTFTLAVTDVNEAPTFTKGSDITIDEDAQPQSINWASNISAIEPGQSLVFLIGTDNDALFSTKPAIDSTTGKLTYTLAKDANGVANVTVKLQDSGGTANGGVDTSAAQPFILTVNSINDAPGLTVPIADQVAQTRQPFTVTLPDNTFADIDAGDTLTLSATLADGSSLPSWLSFNASTRSFSGTPDFADASSLNLRVTATDRQGASISDTFTLTVKQLTGELGIPTPPILFSQKRPDDIYIGTAGADNLFGTWRNDVLRGRGGNDILRSGFATALFGQDKLYGEGGNDRLYGGRGKDLLDGGQGDDRLYGGNSRDLLKGGDGSDRLVGGQGDDILVGGSGNDVLTGNQGKDTFVFDKFSDAIDTIADFKNEDLIDLRSLLAQPQFAAVSAFAKFTQFVKLQQIGADTQIQIDTDGIGAGAATTTLAVLKNIAVGSVTSKQFLINS